MIKAKNQCKEDHYSNYVSIVGAVNIDITGTPKNQLVEADSNPGTITVSLGGVGRNIAENIARLGSRIEFISALSNDLYSHTITESCEELGIGIENCLRVNDTGTSVYLCVNDNMGDMHIAINDMSICDKITPEFLCDKLSIINRGKMLVIDANIPKETVEFLADNCKVPIICEPVSSIKAQKIKNILNKIYIIKPNLLELEALSGVKITDEDSFSNAIDTLLDIGTKNIVVSLGSKGVYFASKNIRKHICAFPCDVVNTTGCGDALMAGIVWALHNDIDILHAIEYGLSAASICIEHQGAISTELTNKKLTERVKMFGNTQTDSDVGGKYETGKLSCNI